MYPMTSSAETIAIRKPRAIGWERLPVWVRRGIIAAVLVAAWHLYAVERGPLLIATPWQTAQAFWDGWTERQPRLADVDDAAHPAASASASARSSPSC